ncbi:MAG: GNAT family N-acetyltransferase [Treponema sp.]|nr:GNAT family N-acetyltransferase [Treponema sp.]
MIIRMAETKDIPLILQVVENSYLPFTDQTKNVKLPSYTYEEIDSLIKESKRDVWIAEQDGKIIGVAVGMEFGPRAYHLKMLFVAANYQKKTIGKALLDHFEQRGRERHFSLFTSNYLSWAKWSWKFYEKHGYKEYTLKDEDNNSDLKEQVAFLKEIGKLNNGDKHLIWKRQ